MAPMTFPRSLDARRLSILEQYVLRIIILFFIRAAQDASKPANAKTIHALCKKITYSLSAEAKYRCLSRLENSIRRLVDGIGVIVVVRRLWRTPELVEFCDSIRFHPWVRKKWDPIILTCSWLSPSLWTQRVPSSTRFDVIKVVTAHWEWTCFRHYRENFKYWALCGRPCHICVELLRIFSQNVEYDRPSLAYRLTNAHFSFLKCLPRAYLRARYTIQSLEPLIMIIYQAKNLRWLIWWDPPIRMQTGFSASEIYRNHLQASTERDASEGNTKLPRRLARSMFEYRDLIHMEDNLRLERFLLEGVGDSHTLVDEKEAGFVHYFAPLLPPSRAD